MLTRMQLPLECRILKIFRMNISELIRPNIVELEPYSAARYTESDQDFMFLDANENPFGEWNRYPDPLQKQLKQKMAEIMKVSENQIFLGNGSDEIIDLLMRVFCVPQMDAILTHDPGYGIYKTYSKINDIQFDTVNLAQDFSLSVEQLMASVQERTKLIFICSPNNPTGNIISISQIESILKNFSGIVVVDEAYIDFSEHVSSIKLLNKYNNLIVLQTFSKAWGLAGLRLGVAYADSSIVDVLNKVKPPYNVNSFTQKYAMQVLDNVDVIKNQVRRIVAGREKLFAQINKFGFVENAFQSEANFILIRTSKAAELMKFLKENRIIIRDRSKQTLCENTVRISVGSEEQTEKLISLLGIFDEKYR